MLDVGVFSLPKSVLMLSNSGYSVAEFKQIAIVPQYANLAHSVVLRSSCNGTIALQRSRIWTNCYFPQFVIENTDLYAGVLVLVKNRLGYLIFIQKINLCFGVLCFNILPLSCIALRLCWEFGRKGRGGVLRIKEWEKAEVKLKWKWINVGLVEIRINRGNIEKK